MASINKEQIELLVKLQKIEIDAAGIQKQLDSVDHRIEALEASVNNFEKVIENEETVIRDLNQKYKAYETDVQMNLERISKSKQKLSSVKTNKEYQSSLKEIADLEAINSKIEDEMLEFLDHIEGAENKRGDVQVEYSANVEKVNTEKMNILEEAERGKKDLLELNVSRDNISRNVESQLLEIFSKSRSKQVNRIGIVPVSDAVCQGCNMNIPPQMYNDLHRFNRLEYCPYCQRIIYLDDHNGDRNGRSE